MSDNDKVKDLLKQLNMTSEEFISVMYMAVGYAEITRLYQQKIKRERRAANKKARDNNE